MESVHPLFVLPSGFFGWMMAVALVALMAYFVSSAQVESKRFPAAVTGAVCGAVMWLGINWALEAFMYPGDNAFLAIVELIVGCLIAFVGFGVAGMFVPTPEARKKMEAEEKKRLDEERERFEHLE